MTVYRSSSKDLITIANTDMGPLIKAFDDIPKELYNRHLGAAMKKALQEAKAIQTLRQSVEQRVPGLSPQQVEVTRTTRRKKKDGTFSTRTNKSKKTIRSKSNFLKSIKLFVSKRKWGKYARPLIARVGWEWPKESRKAIWLEDGTTVASPFRFVGPAMAAIRPRFQQAVAKHLLDGLEAVARVMEKRNSRIAGRLSGLGSRRRRRR